MRRLAPLPRSLVVALAALTLVGACAAADDDGAVPTSTLAPSATIPATTTAADDGEVATAPAVASAGCDTTAGAAVHSERRTLPGSDRWYLLTTPRVDDRTTPLPIVLDLHGLSEGAEVHTQFSGMADFAEQHGFIAVLPHGTGSPVRWDVSPDRAANPDLVFLDQLLDQLEADLCVDTARVYATGLSNGALLSSSIACAMADRVAAVAPVAGLFRPPRCAPSRSVPVLAFHGTADAILLFNGGVGDRLGAVLGGGGDADQPAPPPEPDLEGPGYPASAAAWAEANGCDAIATDTNLSPTAIERSWECPDGADVRFVILVGGGHSWPGSEFSQAVAQFVGPTDMSIDANAHIWAFFQRFALPTARQ